MSTVRDSNGSAAVEDTQQSQAGKQFDHASHAQWLKDNPAALPQVSAGHWAVYDREGRLCGHLTGDGPTRETRFKAVTEASGETTPDSYGITLHDAGAYLLDAGMHDDPEEGDRPAG
ncbi:hypothetical protein [Nonomuraea sp. LPB2021202275-12-8]|uniref:hypothetical protein n=1 Tax=Nonomuraea sp. LPB2021202275-12-8 TaxID=3120159 RepID=UPI00300CE1B1